MQTRQRAIFSKLSVRCTFVGCNSQFTFVLNSVLSERNEYLLKKFRLHVLQHGRRLRDLDRDDRVVLKAKNFRSAEANDEALLVSRSGKNNGVA